MSHADDGALHAYLDGELSALETAKLEAHLAECAGCRERLEAERALIARARHLLALAGPPPPERAPPPLPALGPPRLWWRVRWPPPAPAAWAATALLALAVGWYLRGERVAPPPPTVAPTPSADESPLARALVLSRADEAVKEETPPLAEAPEDRAAAPAGREADQIAEGALERKPEPPGEAPAEAQALLSAAVGEGVPITADSARTLLGTEPVALPDIPVRDMRVIEPGVVLVEQVVDSDVVIRLLERRATPEDVTLDAVTVSGAAADSAAPARVPAPERQRALAARRGAPFARWIGPLRVEIEGRLPVDSLRKLLEQVMPLRK